LNPTDCSPGVTPTKENSAEGVPDISEELSRVTLLEGSESLEQESREGVSEQAVDEDRSLEPLDAELDSQPTSESTPSPPSDHTPSEENSPSFPDVPPTPLFDDPSDNDDDEGEWITPSNVSIHKSRALNLLPSDSKGKGKVEGPLHTGCMTADFAMQNVLLQMGLSLVSVEGKRIEKVKSWVLRCHACFKCVFS
jgi:RNA-binding protein NOB1